MKRKHTSYSNENFPRTCDLCESVLKSKEELDKHMKSHSYKCSSKLKYKCEECEFWGPNEITMEVHTGKHHSDKFKCGLCGERKTWKYCMLKLTDMIQK